jgi:hypothetical protein
MISPLPRERELEPNQRVTRAVVHRDGDRQFRRRLIRLITATNSAEPTIDQTIGK